MTITRFLPAVLLAVFLAEGPAVGQYDPRFAAPTGTSAAGPYDPAAPPPIAPPPDSSAGPPVSGLAVPLPSPSPGLGAPSGLPSSGLTNPAARPLMGGPMGAPPGGVQPGAYLGPWAADGPSCCGPMRGGPLTYELYAQSGPNFILGVSDLAKWLHTGWMTQVGTKTLFFNQAATSAWILDLGLSYTFNRGSQANPQNIYDEGTPTTAPALQNVVLRNLDRTSFNFGIGRDWWLWGPGMTSQESGWNWRAGAEVGGRYGTSHVDLVPTQYFYNGGYLRRQDVYHGVFVSAHTNIEVPVGGWIWFGGANIQWGYDFTNLIPPENGNISNLNFLLTTGIRF